MSRWRNRLVPAAVLAGAVAIGGLSGSYLVPLEHPAIEYATRPLNDPVFRLQQRITSGEVKLVFDDAKGYLPSVLKALSVPSESQVLVFSKTSFQAPRIAPPLPRALYFNDNVSVGWVRGGDVLEITSVDPKQGTIFYTLDQEAVTKPRFERQDTCLQCHVNGATSGVPGLVVRSVYSGQSGMPIFHAGTFVSDHRSPLKERWGGWYVSGTHGDQVHMGNTITRDLQAAGEPNPDGMNVTSHRGRFDTRAYLSPYSDIVALLTLEHQTRMTNLITRVGFETRIALYENETGEPLEKRIQPAVEELVAYMLFSDEEPLTSPIEGVSGFAESFGRGAIRDAKGRSLRDLDLRTRLLRYPCSYLIYSEAFDGMPAEALDRTYRRMWEVLTGKDTSPKFARLRPEDRKAVLEILRATKKGLPDYWAVAAK